jgi:poly-gamma-glutamate synthesis protein (capsule biosynthesis protein)
MGCNPAGPPHVWATATEAGAAPCDYDWMQSEIRQLRSDGYLPIVTFQYYESYDPLPSPQQKEDFRKMIEAGAVIVSGSQAHRPQAMEFMNGGFIHYGLGNLFFDQMDTPYTGTRNEYIDRHIFYDGRYIGTVLMTAMLEDYAKPRPTTAAERLMILGESFKVSGWGQ